jgi:hypothetical protein
LRLYLRCRTGVVPRAWQEMGIVDAITFVRLRLGLGHSARLPLDFRGRAHDRVLDLPQRAITMKQAGL